MADAGFCARVSRIEAGKQWQPDGVLHAQRKAGRRRPLPVMQRPKVRFTLLAGLVGYLLFSVTGGTSLLAMAAETEAANALLGLAESTGATTVFASLTGL